MYSRHLLINFLHGDPAPEDGRHLLYRTVSVKRGEVLPVRNFPFLGSAAAIRLDGENI